MDLWNKVHDYWNEPWSMDIYTRNESLLGKAAFHVLALVYAVSSVIGWLLLWLTSPIWIIPYLIYRTLKEAKDDVSNN